MITYIKKKKKTPYPSELYHYGVKGMKWGVRRTPEQLGHRTSRIINNGSYKLTKYTSPTRESAKSIPKRFAVNVLAMTIPGFGMAYNANLIQQFAKYNFDGKDYTRKEGSYEKLSELKKKTSPTDIRDDLKNANPRLGNQKGKINNCTFCTVAMEMRQRGYDVQARSKAKGAVTETLYSNMFEDFKMSYPKVERASKESRKDYVNRAYDNLCNEIEKCGNGSRGYVGITWEKSNSGHAMYWKVENNRVTFYDGQSGKTNPEKIFALADPNGHSYARLDNLKLKEGVTEAVVSKKSKGDK